MISRKYSNSLDVIVNLFLLITFYIMIAGIGTYFNQELHIKFIIGSTIGAIICFIVYMFNLKGILTINSIIVPILIFGILYMGFQDFKDINVYPSIQKNDIFFTNNSLISAILYASYNNIILIPILITLRKYIDKTSKALKISFLSGIIVFILGTIIFNILNMFYPEILTYDLPMVYIAGMLGKYTKNFYGIIIILSIFTSSISIGFSLLDNISQSKRQYFIFSVILCTSSIFVSKIGFSNLVSILYPLFGYIGLIQLYFLFSKK